MSWSSRYTLAAGIALIIATNTVILIGVNYNRSGEPDAEVALTERELVLPGSYGFAQENSELSLRLTWRVMHVDRRPSLVMTTWGSPVWLDQKTLAALGFDVTADADTPEGKRRYAKMLPREVFVVLEYDGETYQQMLSQVQQHAQAEEALLAGNPGQKEFVDRVKEAQRALFREQQVNSRLFVIDAGTDHRDLRAKYTDRSRYIIARGQVRIMVEVRAGEKARVTGYIENVSIAGVNVPLVYRHVLDPFLAGRPIPGQDASPRYTVKLNVGRRLEPWIVDISAM
jgi:hypothetical protein